MATVIKEIVDGKITQDEKIQQKNVRSRKTKVIREVNNFKGIWSDSVGETEEKVGQILICL